MELILKRMLAQEKYFCKLIPPINDLFNKKQDFILDKYFNIKDLQLNSYDKISCRDLYKKNNIMIEYEKEIKYMEMDKKKLNYAKEKVISLEYKIKELKACNEISKLHDILEELKQKKINTKIYYVGCTKKFLKNLNLKNIYCKMINKFELFNTILLQIPEEKINKEDLEYLLIGLDKIINNIEKYKTFNDPIIIYKTSESNNIIFNNNSTLKKYLLNDPIDKMIKMVHIYDSVTSVHITTIEIGIICINMHPKTKYIYTEITKKELCVLECVINTLKKTILNLINKSNKFSELLDMY